MSHGSTAAAAKDIVHGEDLGEMRDGVLGSGHDGENTRLQSNKKGVWRKNQKA